MATVHVVARGAWWVDGPWERFRPLSVDGTSWKVAEGAAVLDRDAREALAAVVAAASPVYLNGSLYRHAGGRGVWSQTMQECVPPGGAGLPRLFCELTQAELATILGGSMDRAVYTRLQRAEAANVSVPTAYRGELPVRCRVSMRGRHGSARGGGVSMAAAAASVAAPAAAAVAPAALGPITRPNGEAYHPRMVDGGRTDVEVVRILHQAGRSVLLMGAPGTGKTALLEAAFTDLGFVYVAGTSDTVVDDFVGGFVPEPGGSFRWVDGPMIKAAEAGQPFVVDEIALVDPRVMAVAYSLMDGRGEYQVTQNPLRGVVKAAPGFCVHGACNPDAPGADMSEALLSRMTLQVEYGTDYALAQRLGAPARLVTAARNLEKQRQEGETSWSPQMRELLGFVTVKKLLGEGLAYSNLVQSAPPVDRPMVADVLSRAIGDAVQPLRIGEVS